MKNKVTILIWIFAAIVGLIVFLMERRKIDERVKKAVITTGVITNKDKRAKGEKYVAYTFAVAGKEYYGTTSISFCNECKDDCCQIGHSVKVRYEDGNPSNNELIH